MITIQTSDNTLKSAGINDNTNVEMINLPTAGGSDNINIIATDTEITKTDDINNDETELVYQNSGENEHIIQNKEEDIEDMFGSNQSHVTPGITNNGSC